jgi:uncharacterized protein YbjQ (UPF0145 family)
VVSPCKDRSATIPPSAGSAETHSKTTSSGEKYMYNRIIVLALLVVVSMVSGCASVSSSSVPYVSQGEYTTGPISLTTSTVPEDLGYEVVGHIKANARKGYDSVESLYPLLIDEARKVGANAVINVKGGRTVSAFSWAAPFVGGTAVKIDDLNKLKDYDVKTF